jgi:hypothetical protein
MCCTCITGLAPCGGCCRLEAPAQQTSFRDLSETDGPIGSVRGNSAGRERLLKGPIGVAERTELGATTICQIGKLLDGVASSLAGSIAYLRLFLRPCPGPYRNVPVSCRCRVACSGVASSCVSLRSGRR